MCNNRTKRVNYASTQSPNLSLIAISNVPTIYLGNLHSNMYFNILYIYMYSYIARILMFKN